MPPSLDIIVYIFAEYINIDTYIFLMSYSTYHFIAALSSLCNLSGVFSHDNKSFS